jgi:hypothetical protein
MTDWITVLLNSSEANLKREDVYAQLRLRQLRIADVMGPHTWHEIENRVKSDVLRHSVSRKNHDPVLSYTHTLGGFLCVTAEFPRVTLQVSFPDPMIAIVEYNYSKTFGSEVQWTRQLELKFDEHNNHYLMFEGKRFDSVRRISESLLKPLADVRFVPPEE